MFANANQLASLSSSLSMGDGFSGLGFSFPGVRADSSAPALGVSTSAAPLISAPVARQAPEFQASIAPPTRPSNPSIAPPTVGREANAIAAPGVAKNSPQAQVAFDSALGLQMASTHGTGQASNQSGKFLSLGNGFAR